MEYLKSNCNNQKNIIIPQEISRYVLKAIQNDYLIDEAITNNYISNEDFLMLKEKYQLKKSELALDDKQPRNIIFYNMIKDIIPDYKWFLNDKSVIFNIPKISGLDPSLLSLLLWSTDSNKVKSKINYNDHITLTNQNILKDIKTLLNKIKAINPSKLQIKLFNKLIVESLYGKELVIFSPICPDYSIEPTNDPIRPYRHTFKSVNGGIGLVAQRILDTTPHLINFFSKYQINFKQVLAIADYEILSESNCNKLNITQKEFLEKIKSSINTLKVKYPSIDSVMITDLCGGLKEWPHLCERYIIRFKNHDFGHSHLNFKAIERIANLRREFYSRWFGVQDKFDDYVSIVIKQGAEYATEASLITKHYPNCLILGADSSLFSNFYWIENKIPNLYLKRFFY